MINHERNNSYACQNARKNLSPDLDPREKSGVSVRVVKGPMFGSTAGENLVPEQRESIAESSLDRSIPSETNLQH